MTSRLGSDSNVLHRLATTPDDEPSLYMQELTRYLSANMNSVLLGLPTEIKELIYFDALSHAANMILVSVGRAFPPLKGWRDNKLTTRA
jgi:hypothetical protein